MTDSKRRKSTAHIPAGEHPLDATPALKPVVDEIKQLKNEARERQIRILVTVRRVALAIQVPLEELIEESGIRFREGLD